MVKKMENIYKVKVKTYPDPRAQYPSERRYSATTVLGLSCFHFFFAALSLIFASLDIYNYATQEDISTTESNDIYKTLYRHNICYSLTSLILTLGGVICGATGIFAWKKWYIDNNIKWFFMASCLSIFTSLITLVFTSLSIVIYFEVQMSKGFNALLGIRRVSIQVIITTILEFICSVISATLAYSGMNTTYPDDIVMQRGGGHIEVNTVYKGNKKLRISPPDILNHFHVGKLGKYFPKRDSTNLPRIESSAEYRERVDRFLSSNTQTMDEKK